MAGQSFFDKFDAPTPTQQKRAAEESRAQSAERRAEEAAARAAAAERRAAEEHDVKFGVKGAPGDTSKTGEEYLATLPPALATQVKMISEGRMAFPTGAALRSPRVMELVAAASQYDPSLDAVNAATRIATRKNFTSGKARANITSLNTALSHLGSLQDTVAELNNSGFPWWNAIANPTAVQLGDTKLAAALKRFKTDRLAVGEELARAFKGAAPGVREGEEWKDTFSSADSPEALNSAIQQGVKLLNGRLVSLQDEYQAGMGRSVDPVSFLSPTSRKIYDRLSGGPGVRRSPLEQNALTTEIASPEQQAVVGKQEEAITAQLQEAFDKGASAQDLQKMATELYGGKGQLDPAKIQDAIKFRDDFIKRGGIGPSGAQIAPMERAPTTEESAQIRELNDPTRAFTANLGSALTANVVPEFMDEQTRANIQYMSGKHPNYAFAGQVAGAMPMSLFGAYGLSRAGLSPIAASILADTAYGATSGAAQAGEGNRMFGAVTGGATGAGGSLAGRYLLAPAVTKLGQLTKYLPPVSGSDKAILSRAGDLARAETKLTEAERLGLPYGLADTSDTARELLARSARHAPDEGQSLADKYLTRQGGAPERATAAVEEHVAPVIKDVKARENAMRDAAEIAAAPDYDNAFSRMAPVDKPIDDMLNSQIGKKALKAAYDKAEAEGVDPHSLGLDLDAQGDIILLQKPSWETLHWARKGVRDLVEEYRDPVTRTLDLEGNPGARNANKFLQRFTSRLENLNPDYKKAQATYAEYIQPRDYLRLGLEIADPKFKENDVITLLKRIDAMPEATPEQAAIKQQAADALREGHATRLVADIQAAKSPDPYRVVFGSPTQRAKTNLLGVNPADFAATGSLESSMSDTARRVLAGTKAAARDEAKATITDGDIAQGLGETMLSGAPYATAAGLGRKYMAGQLAKGLADRFGGVFGGAERRATELLPRIAGTDPTEALLQINAARQANAAFEKAAQAPRAASTLLGGILGNATQDDNREYPYGINPAAPRMSVSAQLPEDEEGNPLAFRRGGLAVKRRK